MAKVAVTQPSETNDIDIDIDEAGGANLVPGRQEQEAGRTFFGRDFAV